LSKCASVPWHRGLLQKKEIKRLEQLSLIEPIIHKEIGQFFAQTEAR